MEEFDEGNLNEQTGLATTTVLAEEVPADIRLHPEDRQSLQQIAAQLPTGVAPPTPAANPAIPAYLAPHLPPAPEPPAPDTPPPAPVNYRELYEQQFGEAPADGVEVTQDSFEREAIRRNTYDHFLRQHPALPDYRAIVSEGADPIQLIQNDVEARLKQMKLYSPALYDSQLDPLIQDGALTADGQQRFRELQDEAAGRIRQIEEAATKAAEQAETDLVGFYDTVRTEAKSYAPFGIQLPETMVADMQADIRSGKVDAWLDNSKDTKEAVRKALLLSLISDPHRLAEFVRLTDERGQDYGRNRRLATQLN